MYSYIVRRLAFGALAVIGVSIIVFIVLRILPGDPLVAVFGPEGYTKLTEAERAHYMAELGLSDPLVVQYLHWMGDIARGNFGRSFFRAESVGDMILRRGALTAKSASSPWSCLGSSESRLRSSVPCVRTVWATMSLASSALFFWRSR